MKKFIPLLFVLMFGLFFVSVTDVSAYSGGLLNGKPVNVGTSVSLSTSKTSLVTDNKTSEGLSFAGSNYIWYEFEGTADITHYQLLASNAIGSYNVQFYDSEGKVIRSSIPDNVIGTKVNETHKNVKKVALYNINQSMIMIVKEFDVFGTEKLPITHDEITNPFLSPTDKDISMTWTIPTDDSSFISTKIYKNGELLTTVPKGTVIYKDVDILPETAYTYKFVAVYDDGFETNGIVSSVITEPKPTDPALIPPSPVSVLTADSVTAKSVNLSWLKPDDEDFNGVKIYKNGALIEELTDVSSFKITGLSPNTSYTFAVSAVDTDGNESTRQSVSVTTIDAVDDVAPDAPKGLTLTGGNNALYLKWNKNLDDDLLGYNVYVNGVKDNSTVVKNNFYSVSGLDNSNEYQISISAVDKSGNESALTAYMNGVPTEEGMPILSTDYELLDVAKGIEAWFSSMWLIIAFAVAIPLSFYIGARVKLLFLS